MAPDSADAIAELASLSNRLRRRSLRMVHCAGVGHPGGDLSAADILTTLFLRVLRIDPRQPSATHRDRFLMSKGHCSASYYAVLAMAGILSESELDTYMRPLSMLSGHPDRNKVPGVEANTGALGHGLPIAVGAAIAAKMDGAAWRTFVLTGDGELQEGSNWEAAMAAAHYGLDNLTLIVDRNGLQQGGATERTMRLHPLAEKFHAFGWAVREVDGHDHAQLLSVFRALPFEPAKPNCVIAHTHKGKGVSFMEDRAEWHHRVPTAEELVAAVRELEAATP